jgi:flagellar biosynthesis protein FlhA
MIGMATAAMPRAGFSMARAQDLILPLCLVASLAVILVPVPAALMDLLLAANITVAVIVLLTTIYVRTPLEFSVFPSLLLATTLSRLVLNVATTRLILTEAGSKGMLAAGGVVKGFSEFVSGNNLVVGLVIFSIIVVIQFVVITKGATRISEVAARFALDGMPGRQMAIDADLNAGMITNEQAQQRRTDVARQADFFGAMDGASKFVRGDAIAGVIITLINIVGGLVIGIVQYGLDIRQAASLFTQLTIGDGLVSQVPAFLIALASGLLVTRSSSDVNLPRQFLSQLFARPQTLAIAAGFVGLLAFTSLPAVPLVAIGASCTALALVLTRKEREAEQVAQQAASAANPKPEQRVEDLLAVDPMEVEIGVGLIRLADPKRGGDLLERVGKVRQNVAAEMGLIMPKVRIRDNMRLEHNQYQIKIADLSVADGKLYPGMLLAMDLGTTTGTVNGLATREPVFNRVATWIEPNVRGQAERYGYTVVEPASVLATHLTEVVRRHADELLSRDATKHLIDELKKSSPAVVEDLIPDQMKLVDVQLVLQHLLREEISIRQLGPILEALGEAATRVQDPLLLAEYVRTRLARAITARYRDKENRLLVVTLDPAVEEVVHTGTEYTDRGWTTLLPPEVMESLVARIGEATETLVAAHRAPVVLVSPRIRAALAYLTATRWPRLVVLSYQEITRDTRLESVALVEDVYSMHEATAA